MKKIISYILIAYLACFSALPIFALDDMNHSIHANNKSFKKQTDSGKNLNLQSKKTESSERGNVYKNRAGKKGKGISDHSRLGGRVSEASNRTSAYEPEETTSAVNNSLLQVSGQFDISHTDLSSSYQIGLTGTKFYLDNPSAGFFHLKLSYHMNDDNFWGIGSGWSFNIPTLAFPGWRDKICHGTFSNNHCNPSDKIESDQFYADFASEKFPKKIIYKSGSGNSITFIKISGSNSEYEPQYKDSSNQFMRIIAYQDPEKETQYTFYVRFLNNPNKHIEFYYDGGMIQKGQGGWFSLSSGDLYAVNSTITSEPGYAIHVKLTNPTSQESTINITADDGENDRYIRINNASPTYQAMRSHVVREEHAYNPFCATTSYSCFVEVSEYTGKILDIRDCGIFEEPKHKVIYSSLSSTETGHDSCPSSKVAYADQYGKFNTPNFKKDDDNTIPEVSIDAVDALSRTIHIDLIKKNKIIEFENIPSTYNLVSGWQHDHEAYICQDFQCTAKDFYNFAVVDGFKFLKNGISELSSVVIQKIDNNKSQQLAKLDMDYSEDEKNNIPEFVESPNFIPERLLSTFALSSSYQYFPLLKTIRGTSIQDPIPTVHLTYGISKYRAVYSRNAIVNIANEDQIMIYIKNDKDLGKMVNDSEPEKKLYYVKNQSIYKPTDVSMEKPIQSVNYSWGDDHHNLYNLFNDSNGNPRLIVIDSTNDDMVAFRSKYGLYSSADHLLLRKSSGGGYDSLTSSLLSSKSYKTISDAGNKLSVTTFDPYLRENSIEYRQKNSSSNENNIKKTFSYVNNYLTGDSKIYDLVESTSTFIYDPNENDKGSHDKLIYQNKFSYDEKNRLSHKMTYRPTLFDGLILLHSSFFTYQDVDAPDTGKSNIEIKEKYFTPETQVTYGRPLSQEGKSNFFEKVSISQFLTKKINDYNYLLPSKIIRNIDDRQYSVTRMQYDDSLRLTRQKNCVSPISSIDQKAQIPDCEVASDETASKRYVDDLNIIYSKNDDDNMEIQINSLHPGQNKRLTYNKINQLISEHDAMGYEADYQYDDFGRLQQKTRKDPSGKIILKNKTDYKIASNSDGVYITSSDLFGNLSQVYKNSIGQIICTLGPGLIGIKGDDRDFNKNKVIVDYDDLGNLVDKKVYHYNVALRECNPDANDGILLSETKIDYDTQNRVIDNIITYPQITIYPDNSSKQLSRRQVKDQFRYTYKFDQYNTIASISEHAVKAIVGSEDLSEEDLFDEGSKDVSKTKVINQFPIDHVESYLSVPGSSETLISSSDEKISGDFNGHISIVQSLPLKGLTLSQYLDDMGAQQAQVIQGGSSPKSSQSMIYSYDDLGRVNEMTYNTTKEPYQRVYDDDGDLSTVTYKYTDESGKKMKRVMENKYETIEDQDKGLYYKRLASSALYKTEVDADLVSDQTPIQQLTYSYDKDTGLLESELIHADQKDDIKVEYFYDNYLRNYKLVKSIGNSVISTIENKFYDNGILDTRTISNGSGQQVRKTFQTDVEYDTGMPASIVEDMPNNSRFFHLTVTSTVDPRTGLLMSKNNDFSTRYPDYLSYNEEYEYNKYFQLTSHEMNSVSEDESDNIQFQKEIFNYFDNADGNILKYQSLKDHTIFYKEKGSDQYLKINYDYNSKGLISDRNIYLHPPNDLKRPIKYPFIQEDLINISQDHYLYDEYNRLEEEDHNISDVDILPSDWLSDQQPIKKRIYQYDSYNNIKNIKSEIFDSKKNMNREISLDFIYDGDLSPLSQIVSNADPGKIYYQIDYDKFFNRATEITRGEYTRAIHYASDNSIESISGADKKISLLYGLEGLSTIHTPVQERTYYTSNLYAKKYNDKEEKKLFFDNGDLKINFDESGENESVHYLRGINGRVLGESIYNFWDNDRINFYSAYGYRKTKEFTGSSFDGDIQYKSLIYGENGALTLSLDGDNKDMQFQLLGSRLYFPELGKFLEHDSASPFLDNASLNGFSYGAGNPIGFSDPSGHWGSIFQSYGAGNPIGFSDPSGHWGSIFQHYDDYSVISAADDMEKLRKKDPNYRFNEALMWTGFAVDFVMAAANLIEPEATPVSTASSLGSGIANLMPDILSIVSFYTGNDLSALIEGVSNNLMLSFTLFMPLSSYGAGGEAKMPEPMSKADVGARSACFTGETLVATVNKKGKDTSKQIKDVQLGDFVLTDPTPSNENKSQKVPAGQDLKNRQ